MPNCFPALAKFGEIDKVYTWMAARVLYNLQVGLTVHLLHPSSSTMYHAQRNITYFTFSTRGNIPE
jgi:hypothetical protein